MTVLHDIPAAPRRLRLGGTRALKGAALVMALLEAIAAHAKPESAGLRLNARNTPVPGGDAYDTGRGLLAAGDVSGAMAAFRQALVEAPQSVDTLNAIAVCYDRLGRYDVSRSYYDSALALAPGSVQVLNNLGYSLYLQGDLRGAIPLLQQAAAAGDPQATATSRRLLQLISVKLRESEARASMAAAVAELKAPAARVELAANGEQRLVLSAPKVRPEVAATLGEAAALTVVPRVWTARDEQRLLVDEAARERAETAAILAEVAELTAADAAIRAANPVNIASAEAATGITTAFPITPPVVVPAPVTTAPPYRRPLAIAFTPTVIAPPAPVADTETAARGKTATRTPSAAKATAKASAGTPAKAAARTSVPAAAPTPLATAAAEARANAGRLVASSFGYAVASIDVPGWIVASRRDAAPGSAPRVVGQSPDANGAVAGFDSDDPVLNAFAARMRGSANDNTARDIPPEVAISRLEALIARLRRA